MTKLNSLKFTVGLAMPRCEPLVLLTSWPLDFTLTHHPSLFMMLIQCLGHGGNRRRSLYNLLSNHVSDACSRVWGCPSRKPIQTVWIRLTSWFILGLHCQLSSKNSSGTDQRVLGPLFLVYHHHNLTGTVSRNFVSRFMATMKQTVSILDTL